jgi:hypothetical protein
MELTPPASTLECIMIHPPLKTIRMTRVRVMFVAMVSACLLLGAGGPAAAGTSPPGSRRGPSGTEGRTTHAHLATLKSTKTPDFLAKVNPDKNEDSSDFNCMECAWTTYKFWEGHNPPPAAPFRGNVKYKRIRENFLERKAEIEAATGREFKQHGHHESITSQLLAAGPGAHGIVIGRWYDLYNHSHDFLKEHAFNAVNDNGKITYLDGQLNQVAHPGLLAMGQEYHEWEFLLAPSRRGQAIQPRELIHKGG